LCHPQRANLRIERFAYLDGAQKRAGVSVSRDVNKAGGKIRSSP
jgi:hypothetical protein